MFLVRNKVDPRNHSRLPPAMIQLKNNLSLPQKSSSGKAVFEQMKLTQSYQIHDLHSNEFQLNIIPPLSSASQVQLITKKLSSPEWILNLHNNSLQQDREPKKTQENPEKDLQYRETSQDDYEKSSECGNKAENQNGSNSLGADKSQIQIILETTVSEDKERQINEIHSKRIVRMNHGLESKSALLYQLHDKGSQKINHVTFDLKYAQNNLAISQKPKSTTVRSSQNLDQFYREEMEFFSEYGLKPSQKNRLRKIQQLEKMNLLKEQVNNIEANEAYGNQEYFNRCKWKKTGDEVKKLRKNSAMVQKLAKERDSKQMSKKSLSKNMHSLSKGKKLSPKLITKKA